MLKETLVFVRYNVSLKTMPTQMVIMTAVKISRLHVCTYYTDLKIVSVFKYQYIT